MSFCKCNARSIKDTCRMSQDTISPVNICNCSHSCSIKRCCYSCNRDSIAKSDRLISSGFNSKGRSSISIVVTIISFRKFIYNTSCTVVLFATFKNQVASINTNLYRIDIRKIHCTRTELEIRRSFCGQEIQTA